MILHLSADNQIRFLKNLISYHKVSVLDEGLRLCEGLNKFSLFNNRKKSPFKKRTDSDFLSSLESFLVVNKPQIK